MSNRRVRFTLGLVILWVTILVIGGCTAVPVPTAQSGADASSAGANGGSATSQNAGIPAQAGATTFQIVPEESEARYSMTEVLLGTTRPVVGATNQVRGEIAVNPADPAAAAVSVIEIDAGSIATDNERRNTAVRRFILQTEEYPQILFRPTAVENMPAAVAVGDTIDFQLTGELQIRDMTNAVSFDVTVNVVSATELSGTAHTVVHRSDYDLTIPNVPSVTDVSEEIELAFDFVARAN